MSDIKCPEPNENFKGVDCSGDKFIKPVIYVVGHGGESLNEAVYQRINKALKDQGLVPGDFEIVEGPPPKHIREEQAKDCIRRIIKRWEESPKAYEKEVVEPSVVRQLRNENRFRAKHFRKL